MAGEGGRAAVGSRRGACPAILGRRPQGGACRAHAGRRLLAFLAALFFVGTAQAQVHASRIWPSPDYTRLTLESRSGVKFTLFSLKEPERLVLDLETDPDARKIITEAKIQPN